MEKKESLVVYGSNGEILDCQFERVDFSNPNSILNYGDYIKDSISHILDTTAQLSIGVDEIKVDDQMIESLSSFDESLEESDKKSEKKEFPLIKGLKDLLARMGVDKFKEQEKEESYQTRFSQYCQGIEDVCEAVESQKQGSANNIAMREAIIQDMMPLIKQLEEMVAVGKIDLETFEAEIEQLKAQERTIDVEHEIQYKSKLAEIMAGKLGELEKSVVLYKQQIQSYRMQQQTDMEIVLQADSYLRDSAPILKAQGSVMVFNKQQEKRINTLTQLNAATNAAIVKNAQDLQRNAEAVVALELDGGVRIETLKVLDTSLKKGIEIYRTGRQKRAAQITSNRAELEKLNSSMETYQQELLHLLDENGAIAGSIEETSGISSSYQKRKKI